MRHVELDHAFDPADEQLASVVTVAAAERPARRLGVGPFNLRQVTVAIGVVVVGALALTLAVQPLGSLTPGLPVPEPSAYLLGTPRPGLSVGAVAPELAGTRADGTPFQLTDLNGQPLRLADFRGKVVWINFWTSWCPPCQSETPMLRAMDETYRNDGLVIIAVQVQQTVADGERYAQTYGLHYRIGADLSGIVFGTYKAFALPTHFFIDQRGVIREVVNGPLDDASAAAIVENLLGMTPSPSVAARAS
jgi:thiol-disulfide isomerase/thioredoxin